MRYLWIFVVLLTLAGGAKPVPPDAAARAAASNFLALIDAEEYAKAYSSAAAALRKEASLEVFAGALKRLRAKIGRPKLRHFVAASRRDNLPEAPPGKYYVVLYVTDFARAKGRKEVLTPMLQKDGSWRVSGYFVQ